MFEQAIGLLDKECKTIKAEIVTRILAEFRTKQPRQEELVEHSQFQDKQLGERILKGEDARANDQANYKSDMARYKNEPEVAERDLQGRHEAEMPKLHDLIIELKAQMGAISAQRSVARTVVTDNRKQSVQDTHGAPRKRSNLTPEQGGGNGGGQKPPTTMHRAGDTDPDDGDDNDNDEEAGSERRPKSRRKGE